MKVCGRHRLDALCREHPLSRPWVEQWLADVESMCPKSDEELQAKYMSVLAVRGAQALFGDATDAYCVEISLAYRAGVLCIRWAGLRGEYERRADRLTITARL
jgi:hypothetical protein